MALMPDVGAAGRALERFADRIAKEPAVATMPPPITHLIALGGVVYVATSMNVYRVAGDELVRLRWPGE